MTNIKLESGREVGFDLAPFADGKELYRAWQAEMKQIAIAGDDEFNINFIKNIMCGLGDSDRVEAAVYRCMKRCTYNGERIVIPDSFEDERAREDYSDVLAVVIRENLRPFTKTLVTQFRAIFRKIIELRGLKTAARESEKETPTEAPAVSAKTAEAMPDAKT